MLFADPLSSERVAFLLLLLCGRGAVPQHLPQQLHGLHRGQPAVALAEGRPGQDRQDPDSLGHCQLPQPLVSCPHVEFPSHDKASQVYQRQQKMCRLAAALLAHQLPLHVTQVL